VRKIERFASHAGLVSNGAIGKNSAWPDVWYERTCCRNFAKFEEIQYAAR
jgi:hypothetical protein